MAGAFALVGEANHIIALLFILLMAVALSNGFRVFRTLKTELSLVELGVVFRMPARRIHSVAVNVSGGY